MPLTWSAEGVTVTKTYTFRRGAYGIEVAYEVHNGGSSDYETRPFAQIVRNDPPTKRSYFNVDSYAYHGPAIYDGTKYRKLDPTNRDDMHLALEVRDGWLAALQHHFVSALVPPKGAPWVFSLAVAGNQYQLGGVGPAQSLAPGASAQFAQTLFVGTEAAEPARGDRAGTRPRRRLRAAVVPRPAAVLAARQGARAHR